MEEPALELPNDNRVVLRAFTLADYATTSPDGRFFVGGGGVHQLRLTAIPGPILAPLFAFVRLQVPYLATIDPHAVTVRLLDEDEQPIGPDPVFNIDNAETGRAPGSRPGDEFGVNIVVNLTGYPIERVVERELRTQVHLQVDARLVAKLPLKILRTEP